MLKLLLCFSILCCSSAAVIVQTPFGKVEGFAHLTSDGFETDVFLGIPFAQPPIGNLRYEKPVLVEPWDGVYNASAFGPACYVHHKKFTGFKEQSEDCLSVNIVTPRNKPVEKLPVVVFVHGGGFVLGDAEFSGYKKAAERFASNEIIFVSLQYRLGFLGFFSTGDNEIPGNLGLWDQTLALKFIRQVLPSFGGDVNKITLLGMSAGSCSITALLASPHSFDLFNQAIQMSGSGFADFACTQNVVKESGTLTAAVGCSGSSIKKCMQDKSVEELYEGMETLGHARQHSSIFHFQPRFDGDFFPEEINILLEKAPKKKTIQGLASQESFIFTTNMEFGSMYIPQDKRLHFGKPEMKNVLQHTFTEEEFGKHDAKILMDLTMEFYADNQHHHNSSFYITRFTDFSSDFMFNIPVYQEIKVKEAKDWETYAYVIDYESEATKDPNGLITGCIHGGEFRFLLEFMGQENIALSETDKRFQKHIVGSFVNFVKSGSPSSKDLQWLPTNYKNPDRYIRLNADPYMEESFFREEAVNFWLGKLPHSVGSAQVRKLIPVLQETSRVKGELLFKFNRSENLMCNGTLSTTKNQ